MSGPLAWGPRRAVLTLGVSQTIGYASSLYLPAILAKHMAAEFGVGPPVVFGAFSAALMLYALLGQFLGRAVDRRGGRPLLAASSLVLAVGLVGLALAPSLPLFVAAWLVVGAGMALGLYDIAFAGLVGWFGADARRSITGVTLIAGFASTVGWPLTAWMDAEWGWRGACLAWAAAHMLLTLPLHLSLPRRHEHHTPAAPALTDAAVLDPGLVRRQMVLMAIAFAAMATVGSAVSADLPSLLGGFGMTAAAALGAAALVGPSQVAARIAEFVAVRHVHPLVSARIAVALFPIGALLLLAAGPSWGIAFVILYGCGNGLFTIARGALPLALFGPAGYGARLGLISIPSRFIQAVAPFGYALVAERSAQTAMLVLASLSAVGLLCLFVLRRPSPAPSQPLGEAA